MTGRFAVLETPDTGRDPSRLAGERAHAPAVRTGMLLAQAVGPEQKAQFEMAKKMFDPLFQAVEDAKAGLVTIEVHADSVALHTEKFDKVVKSVTKMGGLPAAPTVFVPMPVMGKSAAELRAYVDGADPITGRPVMQEIVEALTTQLSAA